MSTGWNNLCTTAIAITVCWVLASCVQGGAGGLGSGATKAIISDLREEFVRDFVGADRVLKGLRLHRAKDVMQETPPTVKVGEDPLQVKARMKRDMMKWSMLVDEKEHFLGWITYDDLEESRRIRDIIKPPTVTASPDTPLNEALSMMLNSAIGTLAVLDDEERMLGVLTFQIIRDVLGQQADEVQKDARGKGK